MKKGIVVSVNATNSLQGTLADGSYVFSNKTIGALKEGMAITYETVINTQRYAKDADGNKTDVLEPIPVDERRPAHQVRAKFESAAAMATVLGESASLDSLISDTGKAIASSQRTQLLAKYEVDESIFA